MGEPRRHKDTELHEKEVLRVKKGKKVKEGCGASLEMVEPRRHKYTELHEEEVLRVKKGKKEKKIAALRL
jgi:hypothetical protein